MSFGFRDRVNRDRPRLSDRFRGKSGEEIVEELRKDFAKRKQMFFDTAPRPTSSFMKPGFPFDDHTHWRSRGDSDLKSRLDEIAQRYPEFADQLSDWNRDEESASGMGWGSKSAQTQASPQQQAAGQSNQTEPSGQQYSQEQPAAPQPGGEGDARNQRAMSAPPDSRAKDPPQRFVSRLEINPNATPDSTQQTQQQPEHQTQAPAQPQQQPQPQQSAQQTQADQKRKPSNVRHIPIFVEDRNETVMPKDVVDTATADFGHSFGSPPRDRDRDTTDGFHGPAYAKYAPSSFGFMNSPWTQQRRTPFMAKETMSPQHHPQTHHHAQPHQYQTHAHPQGQQHFHPQQHHPHQQQHHSHQQQHHPHHQQHQQHHPQHQHHHPQQAQTEPPAARQETPPRQPQPPTRPKDPLEVVADVQKDVDDLMKQVEAFNGKRQDKQYIYLDEMLTRNLLKLDLVETEGKENVRAARKEAIRCIQKGISLLESKTMTPEEIAAREKAMEVDPDADAQPMEISSDGQGDAAAATTEVTKSEESAASDPSPVPAPEVSNASVLSPAPSTAEAATPAPTPMETVPAPAAEPAAESAVEPPAEAAAAPVPAPTPSVESVGAEPTSQESTPPSVGSSEVTSQTAPGTEVPLSATGSNEAAAAATTAAAAAS